MEQIAMRYATDIRDVYRQIGVTPRRQGTYFHVSQYPLLDRAESAPSSGRAQRRFGLRQQPSVICFCPASGLDIDAGHARHFYILSKNRRNCAPPRPEGLGFRAIN